MKLDFTEFVSALAELETEKEIPREEILEAFKQGIITVLRKGKDKVAINGEYKDIKVDVDYDSCEISVYYERVVVEELPLENDHGLITLEEAKEIDPLIAVGNILKTPVDISVFGRLDAQKVKQTVIQRIKEIEKERIRSEYRGKRDQVVSVTIRDVDHTTGNIYVDLGNTEGILPQKETVARDEYTFGKVMKVVLMNAEPERRGIRKDGKPREGRIMVSRKAKNLVKRLFELEVPEIGDGTVIIESVARVPGIRSKIAVSSRNSQIDPVGACVGQRNARVASIVRELSGEKVDIILWDSDIARFIANALSPAKVVEMPVSDEENRHAVVIVAEDQQSLAIGKEGINAKLAAKLTGWKIDIKTQTQYEAEVAQRKARSQFDAE